MKLLKLSKFTTAMSQKHYFITFLCLCRPTGCPVRSFIQSDIVATISHERPLSFDKTDTQCRRSVENIEGEKAWVGRDGEEGVAPFWRGYTKVALRKMFGLNPAFWFVLGDKMCFCIIQQDRCYDLSRIIGWVSQLVSPHL